VCSPISWPSSCRAGAIGIGCPPEEVSGVLCAPPAKARYDCEDTWNSQAREQQSPLQPLHGRHGLGRQSGPVARTRSFMHVDPPCQHGPWALLSLDDEAPWSVFGGDPAYDGYVHRSLDGWRLRGMKNDLDV
jgi:hypothetical protein